MFQLPYFNNFVLDPLHLNPPPNAPASVNNQPPAGPRPIIVSSAPSAPPPWMNPNLPLQQHHQPSTGYTPGFVGFNAPPGGGVFNPAFHNRPIAGRGGGPMPLRVPSLMDRVGAMVPGEPEINQPGQLLDTTLGRPEGMKDDPRAKRGRVSYNDLDSNIEDAGDPMLNY